MKQILIILSLYLFASAAWADDCAQAFRTFLAGGVKDYPVASRTLTEMANQTLKGRFYATDENTYLSIDETHGIWAVARNYQAWSSTDKGKSWAPSYKIDPAQQKKQREQQLKTAEAAQNITCEDGVEFEGNTYRRISGDWKNQDGTGLEGHNDYYVDADGRWQVSVTTMKSGGSVTKITQTRLPESEMQEIPQVQ